MFKIAFATAPGGNPAGTWRLDPGQALRLQPKQGGTLRVAAGTLWATGDRPPDPTSGQGADQLLAAGDAVRVGPGERLVLEAVGDSAPARFDWDPVLPWAAPRRSAPALLWRLALIAPASALTLAMWIGAAAVSSGHRTDVAQPASAAPVQQTARQPAVQRPAPTGARLPA